jgi:hypothetical protein
MSNAASRDAPPGNYVVNYATGTLDCVAIVPGPQIEPGSPDIDVMRLNPVPQEPPGLSVQVAGNIQRPGNALDV